MAAADVTPAAPKHTPLYQEHLTLGAKLVDFGGWALPVNYGSQIEEHNAVRQAAGMFDVSHMTVSDITGDDTLPFLRKLLANDIDKVTSQIGKALYSCMLNNSAGVIDDLIVYYLSDQHCRLVTNAGTRDKDIAWLQQHAQSYDVEVLEQPQLALLAVQGPNAITISQEVLSEYSDDAAVMLDSLARFVGGYFSCAGQTEFVARTGYTGEDGLEFIVTAEFAVQLWQALLAAGVQPCGLGARDTLRLEAGMSLYGNDLDEQHSPLDSGLRWTVSQSEERDFIGKNALKDPPEHRMVGLILQDRGVLRGHQQLFVEGKDATVGEITSGTFSPTLQQSIGLARVRAEANLAVGDSVQVEVRNRRLQATVARYPFVKNGQPTN